MRLMARAGMDPRGMVALMERLERMEQEVRPGAPATL